ncbi:MAG: hypothetical protein ACQESG_07955 [Nanobdellota archaeon]
MRRALLLGGLLLATIVGIGFLLDQEPIITGNIVKDCEPHSYKACYDGDVYWHDSCGQPEEIAEICTSAEICEQKSCVCRPGYVRSDGECMRTL